MTRDTCDLTLFVCNRKWGLVCRPSVAVPVSKAHNVKVTVVDDLDVKEDSWSLISGLIK